MTDRPLENEHGAGRAEAGAAQEAGHERTLRAVLPKLKRVLAHVPFAEDLLAAYYAVLDRRTPMHVRATLAGALAYFVLPFDVVPDIVAGVGYTDDAAVLIAALRLCAGAIEPRHREAARTWLAEARQAAPRQAPARADASTPAPSGA